MLSEGKLTTPTFDDRSFVARIFMNAADIENGACMKLRKYLLSTHGDPNATVEVDPLSLGAPQDAADYSSSSPSRAIVAAETPNHFQMTLLQHSCFVEDITLVLLLLGAQGISFGSPAGSSFPTPLHLAAAWKPRKVRGGRIVTSFGSKPIVDALLRSGADPNGDLSRFPVTPLHLALMNGNAAIVQSLLLGKATLVGGGARLALKLVATSWATRAFLMLRDADPTTVSSLVPLPLDSEGRTMLHIACDGLLHHAANVEPDESLEPYEHQLMFVESLLSMDCPVNAVDAHGNTALHYAWRCGAVRVVHLLIAIAGADASLCNNDGLTAFEFHPTGRPAALLCLQALVDCRDSSGLFTPINFTDFVVSRGCGGLDVACPITEDTALHELCRSTAFGQDHIPLLEKMLGAGADPNAYNVMGETPLFLACESAKPAAFIKALIDHGGNPAIVCREVMTPLQVLAAVPPFDGVGLVALVLVLDGGLELTRCAVNAHTHLPFSEQDVVKQHAFWRPFTLWANPVHSAVDAHRADKLRFEAFQKGEVSTLVPDAYDWEHHPSMQTDAAPELPSGSLLQHNSVPVESVPKTDWGHGGEEDLAIREVRTIETVEGGTTGVASGVMDTTNPMAQPDSSRVGAKMSGIESTTQRYVALMTPDQRALFQSNNDHFIRSLHETITGFRYEKVHSTSAMGSLDALMSGTSGLRSVEMLSSMLLEDDVAHGRPRDTALGNIGFEAEQRAADSNKTMSDAEIEAIPLADAVKYRQLQSSEGNTFSYLNALLSQRDRDAAQQLDDQGSPYMMERRARDGVRRQELIDAREEMKTMEEHVRYQMSKLKK